jgi:hypothetical protein
VSANIPYASDIVTSWSNAVFALLSNAVNDSPCRICCLKPTLSELKGILMQNNGNGYKVLYDIMQYHATQLNLGTSTHIRNDGPPHFGKAKSIDEYLARYKEYWVQRYFYSTNRMTCSAPELQLSFLDHLPKEIKIAFNTFYWRPNYDYMTADFWSWETVPMALQFTNIVEFITIACDRQDISINAAISRSRGSRPLVHSTCGVDTDPSPGDDGTYSDEEAYGLDHGQVSATTGAQLPLGTCPFCPDYAGRHDLNLCHYLARLYAGSKCLQGDPNLRAHLESLYPGDLKELPARVKPDRPPSGNRPRVPDKATDRYRTPSKKPSSRNKVVHAVSGVDNDDVSQDSAPHDSGSAPDDHSPHHGTTSMTAMSGEYLDLPYADAFGCFMDLEDMDSGCIRALSNTAFPRFAVEDADDRTCCEEFPGFSTDHHSIGDLDYLLHPFDATMDNVHSVHGQLSMTTGFSICSARRGVVPPWKTEDRRRLYTHMDHGANLSVVYDWRLLHRFAARDGIVIHDVGDNRHPTLGHGFLCMQASSHSAPVYIPAFYCPTLASNIISPQQFARYLRGRRSATICDHDSRTGAMTVYSPQDTHDVVLLWADPLLLPPRDSRLHRVVQPWKTIRVPSGTPPPVVAGAGEAGVTNVVRMTQTRAARAKVAVDPERICVPPIPTPPPAGMSQLAHDRAVEIATTRAVYDQAMARIAELQRLMDSTPAPAPPATPPVPATPVVTPPSAPPASLPDPPTPVPSDSLARRHYLLALLHQRLGHLHHRRLRDLPRFADGVPSCFAGVPESCTCHICLASKMRRSPSPLPANPLALLPCRSKACLLTWASLCSVPTGASFPLQMIRLQANTHWPPYLGRL